jgi:hypothetical protein
MKYTTPELIVLGPASVLVLGIPGGLLDNGSSSTERPVGDVALGLDE